MHIGGCWPSFVCVCFRGSFALSESAHCLLWQGNSFQSLNWTHVSFQPSLTDNILLIAYADELHANALLWLSNAVKLFCSYLLVWMYYLCMIYLMCLRNQSEFIRALSFIKMDSALWYAGTYIMWVIWSHSVSFRANLCRFWFLTKLLPGFYVFKYELFLLIMEAYTFVQVQM